MQKAHHSLLEAVLNTTSGFIFSMTLGQVVYPLFGFNATLSQNFIITLIFTVVSIIRSYVWRRVFNALNVSGVL